ncbi:MAG: ATP-binding protein, partial [Verrucomicrobia bacterium]|nr:ATP-binding protein [Verrucomicrobiota bacterium]
QFLNQSISTANGIPSPWMLTGQLALTLFLLFVIDATITCWRRGDPRQSLILGGTIVFFVFAATLQVILVFWGLVVSPITASLFFFGIVLAMGYALSRDLLHATQLSQELQHAERQSHAQTLELAHLSRIALLNELSASLAHELNQPLTVILSNAQAAQRFLAQPHPNYPELSEALQDIVTANHHASTVIQHLRTLFKKGPPQLQSLQINDVLLAALSLLQSDLRHSHTIVETHLAENLPPITGDRVQLAQVFLNLLTNARDAMTKQPTPKKIIVSTTLLPNLHIHVLVHDSGPGIPPHQLQQIFQPFFTTKIHGLGLGLGLCQSLLASHHSLLSAENHPNGGACFHFSLPSITHSNP